MHVLLGPVHIEYENSSGFLCSTENGLTWKVSQCEGVSAVDAETGQVSRIEVGKYVPLNAELSLIHLTQEWWG